MTFDPNAPLDPGQVSDRRGMGGRTGVAIGGGGIGLILVLAYTLLGGNPSDLGPLLEPGAVTGPESSALATECQTGPTPTAATTAGSSDTSTASRPTGPASSRTPPDLRARGHSSFLRATQLAAAPRRPGRSVLLPAGPVGLPRSRVLRGPAPAVRRERRPVRPGLRRRPRVRPPHPEPAPAPWQPAGPARARRAEPSGPSSRPTASPASGPTTP